MAREGFGFNVSKLSAHNPSDNQTSSGYVAHAAGKRGKESSPSCWDPIAKWVLNVGLPADELTQEGHRKRVPPVPILVYQPLGCEGHQHLIDLAAAERSLQRPLRFFHHLLDSELFFAILKARNHRQQCSLPIGRSCPSP